MSIENDAVDVAEVLERYAAAGYEVVIPEHGDLPPGVPAPDLVVARDGVRVALEVKSRADVALDHRLSERALVYDAIPGWRHELLIVDGRARARRGDRQESPAARGEDPARIREDLERAERAAREGEVGVGLVSACRAAESMLSRSLRRYKRSAYRGSGSDLAKLAAMLGLVTQEQYALLRMAFGHRNEYVHGGGYPEAGAEQGHGLVAGVVAVVRKLLAEESATRSRPA